MDHAEIVRKCLEHGILVSPEDIRKIEEGLDIEEFIRFNTIKPEDVEEKKESKLIVRMKRIDLPKKITTTELTERYKNNYESIKKMLLSKTSAISVNNARESQPSVSLIGVVKQVMEDGFVLEDATGEITVSSDPKNIFEDDVIAVRGPVKNNRMICKDIIFPDLPLLRPIGRIEASMLFVPQGEPKAEADIIASIEPIKTEAKNILLDSSPLQASIHKGNKVQLLFWKTIENLNQQEAINMLKKRKLRQPKGSLPDEMYIMDPIPDILWIVGGSQDWIETYKGVTIIFSHEKQVLVDLNTREARQL